MYTDVHVNPELENIQETNCLISMQKNINFKKPVATSAHIQLVIHQRNILLLKMHANFITDYKII